MNAGEVKGGGGKEFSVGWEWTVGVDSGRWTVDSGRWTIVDASGRQWTVDGGRKGRQRNGRDAVDGPAVRAVGHGLVKTKGVPSGLVILRLATVRRPLAGTV